MLRRRTNPPEADYRTIERIAIAFRSLAKREQRHLALLLKKADHQLAPFGDPLRLSIADHRWLDPQREREESYSDWLAWLLTQMESAEKVLRVFGLEATAFGRAVRGKKPEVAREEWFTTPDGDPKRLDIVVRFGDTGVLLVEVKIRELEVAGGAENLPIYCSQLEKLQPSPKSRHAILLVKTPMESPCAGWEVRSWDLVSLQLRRQAAACDTANPGALLFAAMLLCFAGAVEQNLLGLDGTGATISAPQTALYVERFVQGAHHESAAVSPRVR
jgi:hypothetical protein